MLDAFIIERLKKDTEDVQPLPLTVELPDLEIEEAEKEQKNEKKDRQRNIAAVIRF